jgi:hypothetical protein
LILSDGHMTVKRDNSMIAGDEKRAFSGLLCKPRGNQKSLGRLVQ